MQSVAVRLICEREEDQEFHAGGILDPGALLQASGPETRFKALLEQGQEGKIELSSANRWTRAAGAAGLQLRGGENNRQRRHAPSAAPFTTNSLQRSRFEARLHHRKTMLLAQQLYERHHHRPGTGGGAHYLYAHRFDARLRRAQADARELISSRFGSDFIPPAAGLPLAQRGEAHEAIRPTDVRRDPEAMQQYLTRDQARLYKLIWGPLSPARWPRPSTTRCG